MKAIKYSVIWVFTLLILFQGCVKPEASKSKMMFDELSNSFPIPFHPDCHPSPLPASLSDMITDDFYSHYLKVHYYLYTAIHLDSAKHFLAKCNVEIEKLPSNIGLWPETRILIDEAFYNLKQKNLSLGIALAENAVRNFTSLDTLIKIDALTILAELQYQYLDFNSSKSNLNRAKNMLLSYGQDFQRSVMISRLMIGNYNNNNELQKAHSSLDSLEIFCGTNVACLADVHRYRGITWYFQEDETEAQRSLEEAIQYFDVNGCPNIYDHAHAFYELARSHIRQGDLEAAEVYYSTAISVFNQGDLSVDKLKSCIYNVTLMSGKAEFLTDWAISKNNTDLAVEAYGLYTEVRSLLEEQVKYDKDAHIQNQYYHNFFYSYVVKLCAFLFENTNRDIWLFRIIDHLSAYKSSLLKQDLILNRLLSSAKGASLEMIYKIVENDRQLENLKNDYKKNDLPEKSVALTKRKLIEEREQLYNTVRKDYGGLINIAELSNKNIAEKLLKDSKEDGIARVIYYIGSQLYNEDKIYAISIYNGQIKHYIFPDCENITRKIDTLYNWNSKWSHFKDLSPKVYSSLSHEIYKLIFEEIHDEISGAQQIHIIPDNIINFLTFDALVTQYDPAINDYSELPYLVKEANISYGFLIEESDIYSSVEKDRVDNRNGILAMGWSNKETIIKLNKNKLPELSGTVLEVDFLKEFFRDSSDARFITGLMATKEKFMKYAPTSSIIHLALHGRGGDYTRLGSRIYFRKDDAIVPLFVHDLLYRDINPDLVVLSGCETNAGKLEETEGVFSLARGFYKAGAKSVISNIWRLDDQLAFILFKKFYENLRSGMNYSVSLSSSKRSYLNSCETGDCYPGKWTGIVIHN